MLKDVSIRAELIREVRPASSVGERLSSTPLFHTFACSVDLNLLCGIHRDQEAPKTCYEHGADNGMSYASGVVRALSIEFLVEVERAPSNEEPRYISTPAEHQANPCGTSHRRGVFEVNAERRDRYSDDGVLAKVEKELSHGSATRCSGISGGG